MKKSLLALCAVACMASAYAQEANSPVTFTTDGVRFQVNEADQTTVTVMPVSSSYPADVVIPEHVTDASTGISYTVTGIGEEAFYLAKCTTLAIPATITDIDGKAFWGSYISALEVAEGNTVFASANGILYSKDMHKICCFPPEKSFGSYVLPESVTEIGAYAFCGVWLTAFEIPARITTIGEGAFMGTKLRSIEVPATVTSLGDAVFQNCQKLAKVVLPDGLKKVPEHFLATCWELKDFTIPESVEEIGLYAFSQTFTYGYQTDIVIPDKVTTICAGAFQGGRGLKSLTLGKSVASIDLYAFAQCSGLKEITSLNTTVPTCLSFDGNDDEVVYAFYEVPDDCVLYVPAESLNAYKSSWGVKFSDIRPISTGGVEAASTGADNSMVVNTGNGELTVSSLNPVEVFNSAGVKVAFSSTGYLNVQLAAGVYVVRSSSRNVKVLLH